jgi:hypothetical protein
MREKETRLWYNTEGKKDNIAHNTNGEEWPQKEIILNTE